METYTAKEIANIMKVSTRTVSRWIEQGILQAIKVNGIVRVSKDNFDKFVKEHC